MDIRIENLTHEQKEMLEFMWSEIETHTDFEEWLEILSPEDQAQAITLQRLIIIEVMEEFLSDTTEANEYLKQFQLQ